jgi:hypothetical protein
VGGGWRAILHSVWADHCDGARGGGDPYRPTRAMRTRGGEATIAPERQREGDENRRRDRARDPSLRDSARNPRRAARRVKLAA